VEEGGGGGDGDFDGWSGDGGAVAVAVVVAVAIDSSPLLASCLLLWGEGEKCKLCYSPMYP